MTHASTTQATTHQSETQTRTTTVLSIIIIWIRTEITMLLSQLHLLAYHPHPDPQTCRVMLQYVNQVTPSVKLNWHWINRQQQCVPHIKPSHDLTTCCPYVEIFRLPVLCLVKHFHGISMLQNIWVKLQILTNSEILNKQNLLLA